MRTTVLVATLLLAGVAITSAQIADPSAVVLAAARTALGGEKKLSALKSLVVTGRTKQQRGNNLAAIECEIAMELPDKYVRKDEQPLQETDPTTVGFNGATLILVPPAAANAAARLAAVKQDAERYMLGFLAQPSPSATMKYYGKAEAPEGKADVIDISYPDKSALRLFVSAGTHLPIMVSWRVQAAESRLYFSDYRDVGGQQLPFFVRRAVGADTVEETTFDRFRINSKIDPKKFAPPVQ